MTDSEGEGSPGKTSIFVRESNGSMRGARSLWSRFSKLELVRKNCSMWSRRQLRVVPGLFGCPAPRSFKIHLLIYIFFCQPRVSGLNLCAASCPCSRVYSFSPSCITNDGASLPTDIQDALSHLLSTLGWGFVISNNTGDLILNTKAQSQQALFNPS